MRVTGYPESVPPIDVLFGVERRDDRETVRVVVSGELDVDTGRRVEDELLRAERGGPATVVLDLAHVTFFDSTGLQIVLDAAVRAQRDGRGFVIVAAADGEVRRVLELAQVIDRLNVEAPLTG